MSKIDNIINTLPMVHEIGEIDVTREMVRILAMELGILPKPFYTSLRDIPLRSAITRNNRIPAIKELREKAANNGLSTGLKEAKDEIDRRVMLAETGYHPDDMM